MFRTYDDYANAIGGRALPAALIDLDAIAENARRVGASRQSINKELSHLQDQAILQLLPDGILQTDPEALKQLC